MRSCYNCELCVLVGGACRVRVLRSLQQIFSTPASAEEFFYQNKENIDSEQQSERQTKMRFRVEGPFLFSQWTH